MSWTNKPFSRKRPSAGYLATPQYLFYECTTNVIYAALQYFQTLLSVPPQLWLQPSEFPFLINSWTNGYTELS
jgi:hypothetical protein